MNVKLHAVLAGVVAIVLCGADVPTGGNVQPTNDLPNPYRSIAPWGDLPDGRKWGALNGVDIDRDGTSVWVADRCGANPDTPAGANPFQYDSCAGSKLPPVLKFDSSGKLVRSFGGGMFVFPHKIYVDRDGNVWVVDLRSANERERKQYGDTGARGHTVTKFSPEGKVLLTIGKPGVAGDPPDALNEPTSIVMAQNGDLFITEGHSGQAPNAAPDTVARISRFTKDGKFIRSIGRFGSGPVEFRTPHDITMDPQGRLFVADRGNNRVQILDQDGRFIAEWKQFGRPSGIYIRNDLIYVADSESNSSGRNPGWLRGIRIGSLKDGKVLYRIVDPLELPGTSAAEGVAVDAKGNVYGGEVGPRQLAKHVR
ncbi:MAG TPA: peptidyl-alpha-hydroxyglycine alpha-amidating lyase family protein [Burkholderiales bacterium]|jgi:DNA-binding beta-propeller fold protein YncE|nr:peptidyl-alpha-hydroxyglycine alpha-amidating lyase family protein [Burkholderiales bacterium]